MHNTSNPLYTKILRGIMFKRRDILSVKGKIPREILRNDTCVVILDDVDNVIYLWTGKETFVEDKVRAARLAHLLDLRIFGGAARIIQDPSIIMEKLANFDKSLDDIPRVHISMLL